MSLTAYELRAEFQADYDADTLGASVAVLDGRLLDVVATLRQGGDRIVLDDADADLIATLDAVAVLKRAAIGDADGATVRRYDLMDDAAVRAEAQRRRVGRPSAGKTDDVRAALVEQDVALADGDLAAAFAVEVQTARQRASSSSSTTAPQPDTIPPADAPDTATAGDAGQEA